MVRKYSKKRGGNLTRRANRVAALSQAPVYTGVREIYLPKPPNTPTRKLTRGKGTRNLFNVYPNPINNNKSSYAGVSNIGTSNRKSKKPYNPYETVLTLG